MRKVQLGVGTNNRKAGGVLRVRIQCWCDVDIDADRVLGD